LALPFPRHATEATPGQLWQDCPPNARIAMKGCHDAHFLYPLPDASPIIALPPPFNSTILHCHRNFSNCLVAPCILQQHSSPPLRSESHYYAISSLDAVEINRFPFTQSMARHVHLCQEISLLSLLEIAMAAASHRCKAAHEFCDM
jgi:hypothetical protein